MNEAEIADVKSIGYGPWLDKQMDMPIAQTGLAWMSERNFDKVTTDQFYYSNVQCDFMVWNQLMKSPDAVRKRIAFALSEFFVVSFVGDDWPSIAVANYWDLLNRNAFGNFRQLLEDVTLSPAMGRYLSTLGNKKENTLTGRTPDENYAREIMQLFTIGLYELNLDGSQKKDANGLPIDTYSNSDVTNLARVFTGYDYDWTDNVRTSVGPQPWEFINSVHHVIKPMTSDPTKWGRQNATSEHSLLEKKFLKTTIPENTDAPTSLNIALNALFNHANVGPFFSKQMIQRLVTSNPSPAYVERVATVFNNNGSGVRGDLRAVFKAILCDVEAIPAASSNSPTYGKLREPVLRLAQWGRSFGAVSTNGRWEIRALGDPVLLLGQNPFRSPSVFNFFRPGYVPPNTAIAANNLVAPEFQIVTEVSIAGYVNFMISALKGQMRGTSFDVKATYPNELAIAHDSTALLNRLCLLLTANQISDATKATIKAALDATTVTATSPLGDKQNRVNLAILLVMASPEYLVQK